MATINGIHYPEKDSTYNLAFDFWQHAISDAQQALDAANAALIGAKAYTDGEIAKATLGEGILDATDPTVAALVGTAGTASRTQVEGVADARINTLAITKAGHDSAIAGLAADDDSLFRSTLTRNGARPVGRGELMLNVIDFGALGDGVTDDTAAIQAALTAARDAGGATVLLPKGRYMMSGFVDIYSDTTISGYGAALVKPPIADRDSVAFFAARTGTTKGYGAGGENITFLGVTIEGRSWAGENAVFLAAHHARNVIIRDCVAYFCIHTGHWIDLGGCDGVLVDNCRILGASDIAASQIGGEAVQVDISHEGTLSVPEDAPGGADWLPTRNVVVRGCTFAGARHAGVDHPAPVAFGSHTSPQAGSWYENLTFVDNICGPTHNRNYNSGIAGVVRLNSARGAVVRGNQFDLRGVTAPGVCVQEGPQSARETRSYNVTIADNTFRGHGAAPALRVEAGNAVSIQGNVIESHASVAHAISVAPPTRAVSIQGNMIRLTANAGTDNGIVVADGVWGGIVSNNGLYADNGAIKVWSSSVMEGSNQVSTP